MFEFLIQFRYHTIVAIKNGSMFTLSIWLVIVFQWIVYSIHFYTFLTALMYEKVDASQQLKFVLFSFFKCHPCSTIQFISALINFQKKTQKSRNVMIHFPNISMATIDINRAIIIKKTKFRLNGKTISQLEFDKSSRVFLWFVWIWIRGTVNFETEFYNQFVTELELNPKHWIKLGAKQKKLLCAFSSSSLFFE